MMKAQTIHQAETMISHNPYRPEALRLSLIATQNSCLCLFTSASDCFLNLKMAQSHKPPDFDVNESDMRNFDFDSDRLSRYHSRSSVPAPIASTSRQQTRRDNRWITCSCGSAASPGSAGSCCACGRSTNES